MQRNVTNNFLHVSLSSVSLCFVCLTPTFYIKVIMGLKIGDQGKRKKEGKRKIKQAKKQKNVDCA